jgi:hypothetical protein
MMAMVGELESKLTPAERKQREIGFEALRRYIHRAALGGGTGTIRTKRFPFRAVAGIRIDLEVLKGTAAVADQEQGN